MDYRRTALHSFDADAADLDVKNIMAVLQKWLKLKIRLSSGTSDSALEKHSYQAIGRQIFLYEFLRRSRVGQDDFGCQVATANGAFHRRRPASRGPIPCQEHSRESGFLWRAPLINAGLG